MGEVITLQVGHFANLVGAEFWRAPSTTLPSLRRPDGTPRVLLFDTKDALDGAVAESDAPVSGTTDTPAADETAWEGDLVQIDRLALRGPAWRDVKMHDRSTVTVSSHMPASYAYGRAGYKELDIWESQLRFFVEECDALQGFHLVSNFADGFGGVSCALLDDIRDEMPKSAVVTFFTQDSNHSSPDPLIAAMDAGQTLSRAHGESSLVIPHFVPDALTAARSIEAMAAPYTSVDANSVNTSALCHFVTWRRGARLALSRLAVAPTEPFTLPPALLSYQPAAGADVYAESVVFRGLDVAEEVLRRDAHCVRQRTTMRSKDEPSLYSRLQATDAMREYAENVADAFEKAPWRMIESRDEHQETVEELRSIVDNV